jgi:hypothetical protein
MIQQMVFLCIFNDMLLVLESKNFVKLKTIGIKNIINRSGIKKDLFKRSLR